MTAHQDDLFGYTPESKSDKYTSKIAPPIYEPSERKPDIFSLCDKTKALHLIRELESADITEQERAFLLCAAARHYRFDYEAIADYYAHASAEMQHLMERSALVIIDFDKAIENGFVRLSDEMTQQWQIEQTEGDA